MAFQALRTDYETMTWPMGGGWVQDGRTFPPHWLPGSHLCFLCSPLKTQFLLPRWGGSSPHRPPSSPQGSLSLLGSWKPQRRTRGIHGRKQKRESGVCWMGSPAREAVTGGYKRAGACTHPAAASHQVVNPALSRMGRAWKGSQQSRGTQGM